MAIKVYREILSIPGAAAFCAAGLITRYPMAMFGLGTILMVKMQYQSYSAAGLLTGANVLAVAVGSPVLARLVDLYGQRRAMLPAFIISNIAMIAMGLLGTFRAPIWTLFVTGIIGGASAGQTGALIRSRWSAVCADSRYLRTAFALESTLDEVCFATGPVLTTMLCTLVLPAAAIFFAVGCTTVGGFWLLSQRQTEPPSRKQLEMQAAVVPNRVFSPPLVALSLMVMVIGTFMGQMNVVTVAFSEGNWGESWAGLLFSGFAVGSMIAGIFYGAKHFQVSQVKLFLVGMVGFSLAAMSLSLAGQFLTMLLAMTLTGMFLAPSITNVNAMVQQTVEPGRLTEGLTWIATANCVGVALGASIAGYILDGICLAYGYYAIVCTGGILIVFTLLSALVYTRYLARNTQIAS